MRRLSVDKQRLRLHQAALIMVFVSLCWVFYSAFGSLRDATLPEDLGTRDVRGSADKDPESEELARVIAGSSMIRPAHAVKALKNDGTVKALMEKVRFRGVVRKGEAYVAYLSEEGKGTSAVQKGDSFLGFVVNDVGPRRVALEFDGSIVELKQ